MAIFHFSASVVKRSVGRSVVAAAAWQRGTDLWDERLGRRHSFARRGLGWWSTILLPNTADKAWLDPECLWNIVESRETRVDAQLARRIKLVLPYELTPDQNVTLVRGFAKQMLVSAGMVADVTVRLVTDKGEPSPFASVLTTMRAIATVNAAPCFGEKVRAWNSRAALTTLRATWANHVNSSLEAIGCPARVDHRSMAGRGLDIEPQINIGIAAKRRHERGKHSDRVVENNAIVRRRATGH